MLKPLLSLFPGVGLFDMAFEAEGFCVVRGPDLLWGGDICKFAPAAGCFLGVFGGSPCQDFSGARRDPPSGNGKKMLAQFKRVVLAADPQWWLLENVARVPNLKIKGFSWQRIDVDQAWYSGVSRLRHFQFGSKSGRALQIAKGKKVKGAEPAALASDGRSFAEVCRLQGLPAGFDLPGFTIEGKIRAVGNGVPLVMGRTVAQAVRKACGLSNGAKPKFDATAIQRRACKCGCGRVVKGRSIYDSAACRKRQQRKRDRSKT